MTEAKVYNNLHAKKNDKNSNTFANFMKKVRSNFVCHPALFKSCVRQNSNQKIIQFYVKLSEIGHFTVLCLTFSYYF